MYIPRTPEQPFSTFIDYLTTLAYYGDFMEKLWNTLLKIAPRRRRELVLSGCSWNVHSLIFQNQISKTFQEVQSPDNFLFPFSKISE